MNDAMRYAAPTDSTFPGQNVPLLSPKLLPSLHRHHHLGASSLLAPASKPSARPLGSTHPAASPSSLLPQRVTHSVVPTAASTLFLPAAHFPHNSRRERFKI